MGSPFQHVSHDQMSGRDAVRRRVKRMYAAINQGAWQKCFSMLDPALRNSGKVDPHSYQEQLSAFKKVFGTIKPWYMRIGLHLDGSANKRDPRAFAYVYVIWQDERH